MIASAKEINKEQEKCSCIISTLYLFWNFRTIGRNNKFFTGINVEIWKECWISTAKSSIYDDIREWDLCMHGKVAKVITEWTGGMLYGMVLVRVE